MPLSRSVLAAPLAVLPLVGVTSAWAAAVPTESVTEDGISFLRPTEWTSLVEASAGAVTLSNGLFTTLRVQWFPLPPFLQGPDARVDLLGEVHQASFETIQTTLENTVPFGSWTVTDRGHPTPTDATATLRYHLLGYEMDVGVVVHPDLVQGRVVVGFLFTSAERFAELDGHAVLTEVVGSVFTDDDLRAPHPMWTWPLQAPAAIAWPPLDPEEPTP